MHNIRAPSSDPLRDARSALRRLDTLEGMPLKALATKSELAILHQRYNAGGSGSVTSWHADVVERILGIATNNIPDRDLPFAEVKVIPVLPPTHRGRVYVNWPVPKEDTRLCSLNYNDLFHQEFYESSLFHKVSSVLFVPIVWGEKVSANRSVEDWENMYISKSFLWIPDSEFLSKLKIDYDSIRQDMMTFAALLPLKPAAGLLTAPLTRGSYLDPRTGGGQNSKTASNFIHNGNTYRLKKKTWFYPKKYTYEVMQHVLFD
jgi:hypothetical protein